MSAGVPAKVGAGSAVRHSDQGNVPKLRFPEFMGQWEQKRFDQVFHIRAGGDIDELRVQKTRDSKYHYPVYANSAKKEGLYGYSDIFKVQKECVTVAGRGVNIGLAVARTEPFYPIVRLLVLIPKQKSDVRFQQAAISRTKIFVESTGVPQLTGPQMASYKIWHPSLPEQQKIAAFLGAVDAKLAALGARQAALGRFKAGLMQKLFSQQLRFTQDDGQTFPDWQEKRLGDVASFFKGKGVSKSDIAVNGETPCIHYGELFTVYSETISNVRSRTNTPGFVSAVGDVLMPSSDVTPDGLAKASALMIPGVILGGDINIIRPDKRLFPQFLSYAVTAFRTRFMRLVTGTTVKHLYISNLKSLVLPFPHPDEQQKIADALSAMDARIGAVAEQIATLERFKKGLLQQMFV